MYDSCEVPGVKTDLMLIATISVHGLFRSNRLSPSRYKAW